MERIERTRSYLDMNMSVGEVLRIGSGTAAVFSARAPDKDSANEDAAVLIPTGPDSCVMAVADGAGGLPGGERASGLAVRALENSLRNAAEPGDGLRGAILDGIEAAAEAIRALGIGAGTTLAAVEVQGRSMRSYHVGDSMILVVGQRGKIKFRTVSHSPVGYAVEAGFLDAGEAMHHEDRHLVSNIVGSADMSMEIGTPLELAPRDTLILATDGLFDNLLEKEIAERIRKGGLDGVSDNLARECRRRMESDQSEKPSKPDDLTFVVYRPASAA